jgi:hypothetical protein
MNVNNNGNSNNNNASNSNGVAFGSSRARQSNRWVKSVQSGEKEHLTIRKENIEPDGPWRTLLAWRRLMVMRRFMP